MQRSERDLIPPGVVVWFQQNGWMDTNLMKNYVDYINESRINTTPTMMVYDSFRGHLEESV